MAPVSATGYTCPTCGAQAGNPWCYTETGFPRHPHAARTALAHGVKPAGPKPAGSLTSRAPSAAQQKILALAVRDGGRYLLSGYQFHGDAQRRSAMAAMADPARGWFRFVEEREHGSLYEITAAGLAAFERHEEQKTGDHQMGPSEAELRQAQPEDTTFNINRERLRVLDYAVQHRARRNESGRDVLTPANDKAGYGSNLGGQVRNLWTCGLLVLGNDSFYQLTDAGVRRREEVKAEYAAKSVTEGK